MMNGTNIKLAKDTQILITGVNDNIILMIPIYKEGEVSQYLLNKYINNTNLNITIYNKEGIVYERFV